MIQVENLEKQYGSNYALKKVTFDINQGEIVGLLGPNGAGKTTLMRIITGFIPATHGVAKVCGFDIDTHPKEVKKRVGYLPESCPIYPEMTVEEFLTTSAKLHGVSSKNIKTSLDYVLNAVKIEDRKKALISTLSKGYKQRVGLASCLIHDPEVLILDEPTVGLDPTQIIEIRELIKNLKGERTIILSTHILPEVSQTCERIIIISNGQISAQGTESELISQLVNQNKIYIQVSGQLDKARDIIQQLDTVQNVKSNSNNIIELDINADNDIRPLLVKKLVENQIDILELKKEQMTLEEAFTLLTQEQ